MTVNSLLSLGTEASQGGHENQTAKRSVSYISHCAVPSRCPPRTPGLGLLSSSVNRFTLRVRGPGMPALPAVSHGSRQGAVEDQT